MSRRKEKRVVAAWEEEGGRRIPFRGGGGNGRRRRGGGGGGGGSSSVVGAGAFSFSVGEGAAASLAGILGVVILEPEVPPADASTETTSRPGSAELAASVGDAVGAVIDAPAPSVRASWSPGSSSSSS